MAISKRGLLIGGVGILALGGAGAVAVERRVNPRTAIDYRFPAVSGAAGDPVACSGQPTASQIEGPFYKPRTPQRSVLNAEGAAGPPLMFEGRVLGRDCRPIAGAVIDVWHADGEGGYDNAGFRLRGHQFTDGEGRFRFRTVRPGPYGQLGLQRAPHIHVKVQRRGGALLTSQLYFPDDPMNGKDMMYDPSLLLRMHGRDEALTGRFDFVLA